MGAEDLKFMKPTDPFNGGNAKYIRICEVVRVDPLGYVSKDDVQGKRDERFNADPYIIRAKVLGSNHDKDAGQDMPNSYPLLPKHLSVRPKVGEYVFVFFLSEDTELSERFYVGPLTSNLLKLNEDSSVASQSGLSIGPTEGVVDINRGKKIKGVYADADNIAINGRNNADLIFKEGEVRIRAGKFVKGKPDTFNKDNPSYIQLKHDVSLEKTDDGKSNRRGSVTNIVSTKINILGFTDTDHNFKLTDNEHLITDEELIRILEKAQQLVFGGPLLEYLNKLEKLVMEHVHNDNGVPLVTLDLNQTRRRVKAFPKETLLSKNVRIN